MLLKFKSLFLSLLTANVFIKKSWTDSIIHYWLISVTGRVKKIRNYTFYDSLIEQIFSHFDIYIYHMNPMRDQR